MTSGAAAWRIAVESRVDVASRPTAMRADGSAELIGAPSDRRRGRRGTALVERSATGDGDRDGHEHRPRAGSRSHASAGGSNPRTATLMNMNDAPQIEARATRR